TCALPIFAYPGGIARGGVHPRGGHRPARWSGRPGPGRVEFDVDQEHEPMSAAQTGHALITGDQLVEMMGLIRGADSVELKLTIPEGAQRSAIRALRMDP